jgi:hypothetical protein
MPKSKITKIILIFVGLMVIIMLADKLIGANTGWFGKMGNYQIYNSALETTSAFNEFYLEIWFAETLAFILMPFVLLSLRKRLKVNLVPWFFISITMVVASIAKLFNFYGSLTAVSATDILWQLHTGAIFYPNYFDRFDPSLGNALPYLLRAQIPLILIWVIICLALLATRKFKAIRS